jgi:DNA-binding MarR family transcriptional regulator
LTTASSLGRGGAPKRGATTSHNPEADAFEQEYPGASWLAARVTRELEVVGSMAEAFIAKVARRHGLSHAALNALAVIEGNGSPMAAGEVSAAMHITSGTLTGVLDTLERLGYVQRLAGQSDRRSVRVDVTPGGQAVLDKMLPEVQQACAVRLGHLGDRQLRRILEALAVARGALSSDYDDPPPAAPRRTPPRLRRS